MLDKSLKQGTFFRICEFTGIHLTMHLRNSGADKLKNMTSVKWKSWSDFKATDVGHDFVRIAQLLPSRIWKATNDIPSPCRYYTPLKKRSYRRTKMKVRGLTMTPRLGKSYTAVHKGSSTPVDHFCRAPRWKPKAFTAIMSIIRWRKTLRHSKVVLPPAWLKIYEK